MRTIFVGGIHAVGKSTACKAISQELGLPHYSASDIIRREKAAAVSENSKLVANVAENQQLLIYGASRLLLDGHFMLDGHFTMRRKLDGAVEPVHTDVFHDLRVGIVLLYTDHPESIAQRMQARDGVLHAVEALAEHQNAEIAHAKQVAAALAVPLVLLKAFDGAGAVEVLRTWLQEGMNL